MKKVALKIVALALAACCVFATTACQEDDIGNTFGEFGYNGKYLVEYAVSNINSTEAKNILDKYFKQVNLISDNGESAKVQNLSVNVNPGTTDNAVPPKEIVDHFLDTYASCQITTKYYVTGEEAQQEKVDLIQGTDFRNVLEENQFAGFNQLVAKNLIVYDSLIDYMEEMNTEFSKSDDAKLAPFKTIFSYHTDDNENLIIQTRDFSEIPSSIGGGIGCNFRQDTEIIYDSENKIKKWQTSLGVLSATPQGTIKQGYILEVEFVWNSKI